MKNLKFDFASGLVVFFVALPLCIGISLASTSYKNIEGVSDFAGLVFPGLISGIVGGIVVGSFSGSRFGVSGPAAGLITIVTAAIVEFGGFENGGFEKFILAVAIAGVFQLILGFLKAGFIAYYVPSAVIKGMLAGIGVTIIAKEIPHFFGYDKDPEGDMGYQQIDGETTWSELMGTFDNIHFGATLVGLLSLGLLILWATKYIRKNKALSLIPGPLLAIIASIIAAVLFTENETLNISGNHLVNVPIANSFNEFKANFYTPNFNALNDPGVYTVAAIIALVASLETLLCVEATDKLDPNKGRTPMNRELKAQGIGNIVSGLLGGLPITQVIVRSTANIQAGAKTKWSAVIHGVFLVLFIVLAPSLLNMIPRATLAAVLLLIGFKLASPKVFKQMYKNGWSQFIPFLVTVICIYRIDLLSGVGIGLGLSVLWILYRNYKTAYFVEDFGHKEGDPLRLSLSQHATFLNKASIIDTFDKIPNGEHVILDLSKSTDIDHDIFEAINEFKINAKDRNIKLEIIDQKDVEANQGI